MQDKAMISLAGVTKVFYTDDLETHALGRGKFLMVAKPRLRRHVALSPKVEADQWPM